MSTVIFIAAVMVYAFMGAIVGSRHHAIVAPKCHWHNGAKDRWGENQTCWTDSWCAHIYLSIYLFGAMWWLGLPVAAGTLVGKSNRESRAVARRTRELEEAKHKLELAKIARQEDEELELQIAKLTSTKGSK